MGFKTDNVNQLNSKNPPHYFITINNKYGNKKSDQHGKSRGWLFLLIVKEAGFNLTGRRR
jgi:hypothetical protein